MQFREGVWLIGYKIYSIGLMRKVAAIFVFIFVILNAPTARAQRYYTTNEYGLSIGGSQYFGDLNENYGFSTVAPAYGFYIRRHMNTYIALKAVLNYTTLAYDDKFNTIPYERDRNLNFKSDIYEMSFQAEFNFFKFVTGDEEHRFTPYLTGGVGAFYYNPYTYYKGLRYDLRPLGTEGQNAGNDERKYQQFAACFPIGVGMKWWLKGGINISLEISNRLTSTDYIDDVSATYVGVEKFPGNKRGSNVIALALQDRSGEVMSGTTLGRAGKQRGNSSNNDQYVLALFSMSWHFTTYRCPQALRADMIKVR